MNWEEYRLWGKWHFIARGYGGREYTVFRCRLGEREPGWGVFCNNGWYRPELLYTFEAAMKECAEHDKGQIDFPTINIIWEQLKPYPIWYGQHGNQAWVVLQKGGDPRWYVYMAGALNIELKCCDSEQEAKDFCESIKGKMEC